MRISAFVFCLLLLSVASLEAQDFQSWNEIDFCASWRRVGLTLPLLARVDSRLPNPQLAATGITADVPLPWNLTLTGGYLFADLPQRSTTVHIPLIAVSKSLRIARITLVDRNRFERLVGFGASPVRYRNRLLLDFPIGADDRWHVFADDETFFDLSASAWNQNRFQAGGGARLNSILSLDLYYLQRNPAGPAVATRVVGTTLKVMLIPKVRTGLVAQSPRTRTSRE